jgi:hexosaminidase
MGYRLVFSNYDAWYFDCGYGAWLYSGSSEKNNWCSPFKGLLIGHYHLKAF